MADARLRSVVLAEMEALLRGRSSGDRRRIQERVESALEESTEAEVIAELEGDDDTRDIAEVVRNLNRGGVDLNVDQEEKGGWRAEAVRPLLDALREVVENPADYTRPIAGFGEEVTELLGAVAQRLLDAEGVASGVGRMMAGTFRPANVLNRMERGEIRGTPVEADEEEGPPYSEEARDRFLRKEGRDRERRREAERNRKKYLLEFVEQGGRGSLAEFQAARDRASGRYRRFRQGVTYDAQGNPVGPSEATQVPFAAGGAPTSPYRFDAPIGVEDFVDPDTGEMVPYAVPQRPDIEGDLERQGRRTGGVDAMAREAALGGVTERHPLYFPGDELQPAAWAPERIARLQRQLVEAGLLTGTFRVGHFGTETMDAYYTLLSEANQTARNWTEVLPEVQANYEAGIQLEQRRAKREAMQGMGAYKAPDTADLRQTIRNAFRERVGRNPSAAEMATYTSELSTMFRQEYDAETAAQQAQIEQMFSIDPREDELALFGEGPLAEDAPMLPPTPAGPETAAVSPSHRIAELLDQKLATEQKMLNDSVDPNPNSVANSADLMRRLAQGVG